MSYEERHGRPGRRQFEGTDFRMLALSVRARRVPLGPVARVRDGLGEGVRGGGRGRQRRQRRYGVPVELALQPGPVEEEGRGGEGEEEEGTGLKGIGLGGISQDAGITQPRCQPCIHWERELGYLPHPDGRTTDPGLPGLSAWSDCSRTRCWDVVFITS